MLFVHIFLVFPDGPWHYESDKGISLWRIPLWIL